MVQLTKITKLASSFHFEFRSFKEIFHFLVTYLILQISYDTRLVADLRQLLTLRQHYYPEGGWGFVILIITIFVQCVSHGLHMSSGILIAAFIGQFHENLFTAGTPSPLFSFILLSSPNFLLKLFLCF